MIVWVQPSVQHLCDFFHGEMVDMIHKFSQISLKQRVINESSSTFKQKLLTSSEIFCRWMSISIDVIEQWPIRIPGEPGSVLRAQTQRL